MEMNESIEDDMNYEEALEKLVNLQLKLSKLRIELPRMLRILAHIDSSETTQQIFSKSVEGAKVFTEDLEEFLSSYNEASEILKYSKRKNDNTLLPSQIVSASTTNLPANSTSTSASIVSSTSTTSGNLSGTLATASAPNNASSGSLAAQKSIHSMMQSGMSQDEAIILDDSSMSSFIHF